jgi:hypothetical protein
LTSLPFHKFFHACLLVAVLIRLMGTDKIAFNY